MQQVNQLRKRVTSFLYKKTTVLLISCIAMISSVHATNFTPTTFTDPDYTAINPATGVITGGAGLGLISLRSALQAADGTAGPHTITLLAGTYHISGGPNIGTYVIFGSINNQNITINGIAGSPLTTIITMDAGVNQDRIFAINVATLGGTIGVNCTINNVRFTNGHLNTDPYGGGAIEFASTGSASALTLTNCEFINNTIDAAAGTTGGAVNYSGTGTLTVTGCTFTGNSNDNSDGGALYYFFNNFAGNQATMTVTNCTFNNNTATVTGPGSGGAIGIALQGRIAPFDQNFTANITRNSFITNTAPGAEGGAIIVDNGDAAYTVNINFNRFFNNSTSSTTAPTSGLGMNSASGSVIATNNWWGGNTNPNTAGACNRAAIVGSGGTGTLTTNPWLQLKTTASPNPICNTPAGLGNTSTVTTSFLSNSAGTAIPVANLPVLIGLPVTWTSTLGSLSGQQPSIQATGTATATFTSNGTGGSATVNTQVDNVPAADLVARATITVNTLPTVTNPVNATVCTGGTAIFTSTITGTPAPAIVWRIGATALVNGLQGSGSTVSGQGTNTLTISNAQAGDASANYNVQASNTCGTATSANATLAVNNVTGGTVGSDQTICSGGDPAAFTETVASTGSGALTYQWQSSTTSCAAGFSNIGGATATTYDAPSGVAVTTFYRRVTTSTLNAVPCTANSNCITVTVNNVTGGTVAADQTICSGGDPAAFTQTVASTGTALTYQWQSSTTSCAAGFSDIGGATATTYDPPAGLLVTTFYRRVTTSTVNGVPCTANSNCITVSVNDVTGGTVGSDQTICSGGDPAAFTQIVASTGSGALTYQWQSSTTSCAAGFSNIGGATATTYDPPAGLLVTTFYRRVTTSTLNAVPCTANSNCITVTINNVTGGAVAADQTICSGDDPAAFTETVASTGSGPLTYQWQISTTSCAAGFSNIGGATATTYDPPAGLLVTTFYRRVTSSIFNAVLCTANSNCITVTVNNVTGGTVGSDQAVCPGGDPAAFTQIVASTGGGALTYQWQSSIASCAAGFSNIAGATGITYDVPAGLAVTTYYRRVTTSTLNAVLCTANSNCITVTVNPTNTITLTSGAGTDAQTVLVNTPITNITYSTTGATGATFSGLPPGVTGNWAANVVTISGSPTTIVGSPFNYTVTLTGGCGLITVTGTITVFNCSITLTSGAGTNAQTVCNNTPIANITYSTTGATGATFSGLPGGVTGNWAANVVTISGTAIVAGTFNYTVTLTGGGCGAFSATGTITVNPIPNAVATPASQTSCSGSAITTIVLTGNAAGTVYNWTRDNTVLVTGIAASGSGDISGTLTNSSNTPVTVTFTITPSYTNGGVTCIGLPITATVVVNPVPNAVATPAAQTICSGSGITTIALTSNVGNTVFNWTRNNTATVTGIAASGSGDISGVLVNTTNAAVTVTFTITPSYTNGAVTCTGTPITATVIVNPIPNAVATPAAQTICSGSAITSIVLTGNVAGTIYNWTRDNTVAVTGIAASGSGNISGALTNTTFAPVTVTFTITPSYTNAGVTCMGPSINATVVVNPIPNAVASPSSQTICSASPITAINISGNVTGTVFNWTRDNTVTVTGIAASGSGDISGSLTNTTTAPVTVTFTITPSYTNAGATCTGAPITATVLVNPTPNAVATPAGQTICSGNTITTIVLTGAVAGTTFSWTRNNTVTVIGIATSGSGNISGALTNLSTVPVTVTFTITPTANGCPGPSITATVLVNPTPDAVAAPPSQTICSGGTITTIVLSGNVSGTIFNWTRNNTVAVTGIAASGSGNISGALTNTTNAPVTVTFTITPTANGCPGAAITATVLVNPTPNAVAAPATQTICSGGTITTIVLSGAVAGTTFDWTRNNLATVTGIAASGSGNISGVLTSNVTTQVTVTFTITPTANGCPGAPITATVVVNPTPTITCPANIIVNAAAGTCAANVIYPPATATGVPAPTITYSIPSGSSFQVGVTTVTATASNICGTVTCTFTITVLDVQIPLISTQPVNRAVCVGSSATFSVAATNVTSYQWQSSTNGIIWSSIAGATASSFTINNTTLSMNNTLYRVLLTGPCGTVVISNVVTLTVNPLPLVTLSSASNPVMLPGMTLTITASVSPAGGTFVWLFNGTVMTGVTGSSLGPLTVLNVGVYTVIYTDPNGCVSTSSPFTVSAGVTNFLWVYPNPNTGQFNVRFYNITGETATLKVFNYMGQVVYTQTLVLGVAYSNFTIDMRRHAAGVYTVRIVNGSGALMAAKRLLIYHP
jgi:hypothetical protein